MKAVYKTLSLFAASAALCAAPAAFAQERAHRHHHGTSWGYTGHHSPEHWAELDEKFAMCGMGKNQSPINITQAVDSVLPELKFAYQPSDWMIVNNGHTVQINFKQPSNMLQIGDKAYTLKQFHFHVPSENQIKGQSFPLEAHFVHSDSDGNLAVVGVLYTLSLQNNAALAPIWQVMPMEAGAEQAGKGKLDLATLLPQTVQQYYRFSGSLTTPPCSEGVVWVVLKDFQPISAAQVKQFSQAVGGSNSRPVQPINARVVVD